MSVRCKLLLFFFCFCSHTFTNTIKHSRAACYLTCLVRRIRRFVVVRLIEFAPAKNDTATHAERLVAFVVTVRVRVATAE